MEEALGILSHLKLTLNSRKQELSSLDFIKEANGSKRRASNLLMVIPEFKSNPDKRKNTLIIFQRSPLQISSHWASTCI
jgi:hypothetical protein